MLRSLWISVRVYVLTFVVLGLAYPLVGMVTEHTPALEIMRVSTLCHAPDRFEP